MNLSELLSTTEREKILREVIYSDGPLNAAGISKKLKISKALVSKYFKILQSNKIIKKRGKETFIENNIYLRTLKILFVLNSLNPAVFKKRQFINGAGVYGSCARGENKADSDIDIWVRVSKASDLEFARFTNEMMEQNAEIKILFLTDEKLRVLKEKDSLFYSSLLYGSIVIYGENVEAQL
jgi:predicted nucleotidyltransferase